MGLLPNGSLGKQRLLGKQHFRHQGPSNQPFKSPSRLCHPPQKHRFPVRRFCLIAVLAIMIVTAGARTATAQVSLLFDQSAQATQDSLGWNPSRSYPCGRLVCSDVYFYGSFGKTLTVAGPPDSLQPNADSTLVGVEERADLVQRTFKEILRTVTALKAVSITLNTADVTWQDLFREDSLLTLHPNTPRIEVGIENSQTVLFIPEQEKLGLQQQLVLTVNEYDAIQNGLNKENLAAQWRDAMLAAMSQQLWETSFNLQYPFARLGGAIAIVLVTLLVISLIDLIRRFLRKLNRRLRRELKHLEQQIKAALTPESDVSSGDEASQSFPSAGNGVMDADPTPNGIPIATVENPRSRTSAFKASGLNEETNREPKPMTWFARFAPIETLLAVPKTVSGQVNHLMSSLPERFLKTQKQIKQQRNLVRLAVQLMFWIEIFVSCFGAGLVAFLYPATRPYAPYVFSQAVSLPIIWIGMNILDAVVDLEINYRLNQWAEDMQASDPLSNRYALRTATYSSALRNASTLLFWALGFYLTVQAFGINPTVLASAGVIAAVLAFISRNVLEDMVNGALILWNDRYAVGDVIQVGDCVGLVEQMNLYITEIRGAEGRLITLPNSQIKVIENLTKDWSRVDFTIEIAYDADVQQALDVIHHVAETMRHEPQWQDKILEPASILGVDRVSHTGVLIQVWIKTQAMQQWAVGREFRLQVKQAFDQAGIAIGLPQQAIWYHERHGVQQSTKRVNGSDGSRQSDLNEH